MSYTRNLLLVLACTIAVGLWIKDSKYLENRRIRRQYLKTSESKEMMINAETAEFSRKWEEFLARLDKEEKNENFASAAAPDDESVKNVEKMEKSEKSPSAEFIYEYMKSRWNHPTNRVREFNLETNYYIVRDARKTKNVWDINRKFFEEDDKDKS